MINLYHTTSQQCSKITTENYSSSFCSATKLLHPEMRKHIYNIYGFVRFADEIVDTFHHFDKENLLAEYKADTEKAIERKISLNPILHSFQQTANEYKINPDLIEAFFYSMALDLDKKNYDKATYEKYIYGSAEVVGLMCLYVFCEGDKNKYTQLEPYAKSLGAALQKVNFLRDIKNDFEGLNRIYFPGCDFRNFSETDKAAIENDIQADFDNAYKGIIQLPAKARFGVYVAYKYYNSLFKKIKKLQPEKILERRVRIPSYGKMIILAKAGLRSQFNLL